jgi:NAD(P)-dependent dehydrogenase (short-subunit alcohol dehydrogenase family)
MQVKNRVAMVTGGGSGIGRATALMLAREGADIIVGDINAEAGRAVVAEVEALGRKAVSRATDSSDGGQVRRLVEEGVERLGTVDILVNNAGIALQGTIRELTEQDWDYVLAVHLKSMFLCSQAVIEHMIPQGWGRIVNIISRAAFRGRAGTGPYSAAKGGMLAYSRVLAVETAQWGITVNNVAPGTTLTPMVARGFTTEEAREREARSSGVITQPVRLAEADEIAGAVLYLCGPYAGHVTGATLHVNGGSFMP